MTEASDDYDMLTPEQRRGFRDLVDADLYTLARARADMTACVREWEEYLSRVPQLRAYEEGIATRAPHGSQEFARLFLDGLDDLVESARQEEWDGAWHLGRCRRNVEERAKLRGLIAVLDHDGEPPE